MANPQKENGHTQFPNKLLEKTYSGSLTLREIRLVLAVARYTFGFHREAAELSVSFLAKGTKLKDRHVKATLKNLFSKNILLVASDYKGVHSRQIQINEDYDSWIFRGDQKSTTIVDRGVTKRVPIEVTKPDPSTGDRKSTQEIKKKTIKKKNSVDYSIEYLPEDLNGELFYIGNFFFVTKSLVNEFRKDLVSLSDDSFRREFYKMNEWLNQKGSKKNYKRFFINWLEKVKPEQENTNTLDWS
jgi:phage replication O-like protein O